MDKQVYKQQKQRFLEEKRRLYAEEPKVERWVRTKQKIFFFMAVYIIVHTLLIIITIHQVPADGVNMGTEVVKLLFALFWLLVCINPWGGWKISAILYWSGFMSLVGVISNYNDLYKDLGLYLSSMPCYGIALIMELLAPFLFLGVAGYLTLSVKNRKLAERAQELSNKLKNWTMENQNLNEKSD